MRRSGNSAAPSRAPRTSFSSPKRKGLPSRTTGNARKLRPRCNHLHDLRDLSNLVDARLTHEVECGTKGAEAARANVKAAIERLKEKCGLKFDAFAALAEAIAQADSQTRAALKKAMAMLKDARRGRRVPPTFHGAFLYECALVGLVPRSFAGVTGVKEMTTANWGAGRRSPNQAMKGAVEAIENELGLRPGYLWDRNPIGSRGRIDTADLPKDLADTRYKCDKMKLFLPQDFSSLAQDQKAKWIEKYRAHLKKRAASNCGKIANQRRDKYRLKDVPEHLENEMNDYFKFRRPKKLFFGDKSRKDGLNDNSCGKWRHRFLLFFGFLVNRLHELERLPDFADYGPFVGIRPEDLTLAFLAVPKLVEAYGQWLLDRKKRFRRKGSTTLDEVELLKEIERMTRKGAELKVFQKAKPKPRLRLIHGGK
jgi:hypothetical protein